MSSNKKFYITLGIMIVLLLAMGINRFVVSFPDWTIRVLGVAILLNLPCFVYFFIRGGNTQK